jgi:hypothetical protein
VAGETVEMFHVPDTRHFDKLGESAFWPVIAQITEAAD